jgi:hypothetical protein
VAERLQRALVVGLAALEVGDERLDVVDHLFNR